MHLNERKKSLVFIAIFIILIRLSIVILYLAEDEQDNNGKNGELMDTIPPSVTIKTPAEGSIVSNITTIAMEATDMNGMNSYAIYIDNIFRSDTRSYSWNRKYEHFSV